MEAEQLKTLPLQLSDLKPERLCRGQQNKELQVFRRRPACRALLALGSERRRLRISQRFFRIADFQPTGSVSL